MKRTIFTLFLLIGFLFVSVAESQKDVPPNEGIELSIVATNSDLVVEMQSIELQATSTIQEINKQVLIIAYMNRKRATNNPKTMVKLRRLSNPGKLDNDAIFNYTTESPKKVKYKIAYGLRNRQNIQTT